MNTDSNPQRSRFSSAFIRVHPRFPFLICLLLTTTLFAQAKWTLTTADFQSRQVDVISLDEAGAKLADKSVVGWDRLLLLDRQPDGGQQNGGKFTILLAGGDQVFGEPVKLDNETLHWNAPAVGEMNVPLRQVLALKRSGAVVPGIDAQRTEDVVLLANGDSVKGIVSDVSASTVTIQSGGNANPVPLDSVSAVLFASTAAAPPPVGRAFRVKLADQSIITASAIRTGGDKLSLTLVGGGERAVPLASVSGIEQLNGPVSWLSSRQPGENIQTPLLETSHPAKMDRTVTGRPIRFGERSFSRGIGVAPYSRLTFSLDPGAYPAFRTQYAIDGNGQYADVTVRVKLDDKIVHERKNFTAGELSPVVLVPLGNSKSLTLEVDFGENYGVQDRFNWIEPALVKATAIPTAPTTSKMPATTSTTAPAR